MSETPDRVQEIRARAELRKQLTAALSAAGAFCGQCGFEPGGLGCPDCEQHWKWCVKELLPVVEAHTAAAVRRALEEAAERQRKFVLSDDFVCDGWEAALTVVDLIDPAVASPARDRCAHCCLEIQARADERRERYANAIFGGPSYESAERVVAVADTEQAAVAAAVRRALEDAADAIKAHPGPHHDELQLDAPGFWWDTRDRDAAAAMVWARVADEMTETQWRNVRDKVTESGINTPRCDCGHGGMGSGWHMRDCTWRASLTREQGEDDEQPAEASVVPRTERQRWQDIADALNAVNVIGIDLDGTLTDHTAWSVIWDRIAERWTVSGYDDEEATR